MKTIEAGKTVEVWTVNGGHCTGTLYESYTESYGVTLCEHARPIDGARVSRVRELSPYEVKERAELREKIETDTFTDEEGCRRWTMGNAVPSWSFEEAGIEMTPVEKAAYAASTARSIESYRTAMAERSPEAVEEERAEARAAHGPGVAMTNILTGEGYVT